MSIVKPPPGTPVMYYHRAESHQPPIGAVMLECSDNGIARIKVFPAQGGWEDDKVSVFHVSDPRILDASGNRTTAADRYGSWDYHPWFPAPEWYAKEQALERQKKKKKQEVQAPKDEGFTQDEKSGRVRAWLLEGLEFDSVCKKAYGIGMTKAQVQQAVDQFNAETKGLVGAS